MKTIDTTIQVSAERLVTLKLPDEVTPGEHRILVVIDEQPISTTHRGKLLNPEGLWADQGTDISSEHITEARKEMWGKFASGNTP